MTELYFLPPSPASTLSVYSCIERYDPKAARDLKPTAVGKYVIRRIPVRGTLHTKYYVLLDGEVLGHQISFPSEEDCRHHERCAASPNAPRHTVRSEPAMFPDAALQSRIIAVLQVNHMDLTALAQTLDVTGSKLFSLLDRMTEERRIFRRGTPHRYIYRAA